MLGLIVRFISLTLRVRKFFPHAEREAYEPVKQAQMPTSRRASARRYLAPGEMTMFLLGPCTSGPQHGGS